MLQSTCPSGHRRIEAEKQKFMTKVIGLMFFRTWTLDGINASRLFGIQVRVTSPTIRLLGAWQRLDAGFIGGVECVVVVSSNVNSSYQSSTDTPSTPSQLHARAIRAVKMSRSSPSSASLLALPASVRSLLRTRIACSRCYASTGQSLAEITFTSTSHAQN